MALAWCIEALDVATTSPATPRSPRVRATDLASAKAFLLAHPSGGVYSCARASTIRAPAKGYELVLWAFHLDRLAVGLRSHLELQDSAVASPTQAGASNSDISDAAIATAEKELQRVTTALSDTILRHCEAQDSDSAHRSDLMLTVLWWLSPLSASVNVSVHVCAMPTPSTIESTVLIHGAPRSNAQCKHTQWIHDRVPLEELTRQVAAVRGVPIHETILSQVSDSGDRLLLEGLITNFFVVVNGAVHTAASDVLMGSTRELVLCACTELGIPVILTPPRLADCAKWDAAFVTSAVRLAASVTRVLWLPDGASGAVREVALSGRTDVVARIRAHILARQFFLDA